MTIPRALTAIFLSSLFVPGVLFAQGARNLLSNPGFESTRNTPNLWYGTGPDGTIEAARLQVPVLTERGSIADTAMPATVSLGDLNADGKLDLLVGGASGYMHVFFNEGTPQEPKFSRGELLPVFLSRLRSASDDYQRTWFRFMAPRIHLADMSNTGRLNIWIGNYSGEILQLPNSGTASNPDFRQPPDVSKLVIPTSQNLTRRWGNVFAPALWDVDGDGRTDLLVGEGSYSANSIHVLLNQGSNATPRFDDTNRHVLAYGMGREQLTPAVVDFNGNGQPDLLVSDRSGRIGLYSSTIAPTDAEAQADNKMVAGAGGQAAGGGKWSPGQHIPFVSYLSSKTGQQFRFAGIPTIAVGDLTGNGAFDIVVGTSNGRVSWIRNSGTPTEPQFEAPVVLKGEPTPPFLAPAGWTVITGNGETDLRIGWSNEPTRPIYRGNFFGFASVVSTESDPTLAPPEGTKALKLGYVPNLNKIIRTPFAWSGAIGNRQELDRTELGADWRAAANIFRVTRELQLEVGKDYNLSFQMKGANVLRTTGTFNGDRWMVIEEGRTEQTGRGGQRRVGRVEAQETKLNPIRMSNPGANWQQVSATISTKFEDSRLNAPDDKGQLPRTKFVLRLTFELSTNPMAPGVVYLDNFSLTER